MVSTDSIWHDGELAMQTKVGVRDANARIEYFRDYLNSQLQDFFQSIQSLHVAVR